MKEETLGVTRDAIILLYDDRMRFMKRLPAMFTDVIMKLEVIKEKTRWRD